MFNEDKLDSIIAEYKKQFIQSQWPKEKFKWEAVKCFQDNWDISADNFTEMLINSLVKTGNLLSSKNNFPKDTIINLSKLYPNEVRKMFIELFDENKNIYERISIFKENAKSLLNEPSHNHYQDESVISTYLWLKYPDKYYIYKFNIINIVSEKLESNYIFKKGDYANNIENFFKFYDEISSKLQSDNDLKNMLSSVITDTCYSDPKLKTLTIDLGYFISKHYTDLSPNFWKISHGTDCISDSEVKIFEEKGVIVVHKYTSAKAKSKVSQGEDFIKNIKKGDYFYLCRGNSIRLLGCISSDKVRDNKDKNDGWCERDYIIIAKSSDVSPYSGNQKWWTPNNNSTCICIPNTELSLFEAYILKPYFNITLNNLLQNVESNKKYTKEDFLKDVYISEEKYDKLVNVLKRKKNIILQGAPGVGKTFLAKRLAYSIMGEKDDERINFIQFHQNYSYEDFVMGYKPIKEGFELKYGIFYNFCQKATKNPDKDYFFIIDEINRGNLSKIFGELLMLIEADYRDEKATLAYTGSDFSVPKNLHIIGMMNIADRSLAMIDYALRRRFSFFDIEPAFDSEGFSNYQKEFSNKTFNELIEKIKKLNEVITQDQSLGKGFCIGHSYFCNAEECTLEWMKDIVEFDIFPMLSEYWFDDESKLNEWKDILYGVFK